MLELIDPLYHELYKNLRTEDTLDYHPNLLDDFDEDQKNYNVKKNVNFEL